MGLGPPLTLPVSALNIGVAASIPGIQLKTAELALNITNLGIASTELLPKAALMNVPPLDVGFLGPALAVHLAALPSLIFPDDLIVLGADIGAEILVKLGLVSASIKIVGDLLISLKFGLSAGGLKTWAYSGPASRLGPMVTGAVGGGGYVQGFVLACESFDSWGKLSLTFNTGTKPGATEPDRSSPRILSLGSLDGGSLVTGLQQPLAVLNAYLLKLKGQQSILEYQLGFTAGLNLPNLSRLKGTLTAIIPRIDVILKRFLSFSWDPTVDIRGVNAQLDFLLGLIGDLQLSLSGGGLTFWSYAGAANETGAALTSATANGLPGASGPDAGINAVVVLCSSPSAMADFGLIFKVA